MKTQLSSRLFLAGLSLNTSILLSTIVSPSAFAQAQADYFYSEAASSSDCEGTGLHDHFETSGDTFSSWTDGDTFSSSAKGDVFSSSSSDSYSNTGSQTIHYADTKDDNSAFSENEAIDPNVFTWSNDPRDVFASSPTDSLQQFPLYSGST